LHKIMTINDVFRASDFLIIGHRGAAGLAPENTLASFRLAIELGCPMLELDVQRIYSNDGTPRLCVFHDDRVDRTTNGKGLVKDYTVEDLIKLRCANDQPIPMLEDVLDLIRTYPKVALNIELKGQQTAELAAELITKHTYNPILVSSFHLEELAKFRRLDKTTAVAPLFARWRKDIAAVAQKLDATAINIAATSITQNRMTGLLEGNLPVAAYTVNSASQAATLKQYGVSGIFTDYPDKFVNI